MGHADDWRGTELRRLTRIQSEYAQVPRLERHTPLVTVFGSASADPGDPAYESARQVGYQLALSGFRVLTGGGPGAMEAANRGAWEARSDHDDYGDWGTVSVGCTLSGLPGEQEPNGFLDHEYRFDHFYARKTAMVRYSVGFVVMPGGFGTLDELFEVLTLMQTGKAPVRPVVLVGWDYWFPLLGFLHERVYVGGRIRREDEALLALAGFGDEHGVVGRIEEEWRPSR